MREQYSAKPGRPAMCFSASRAPVAYTRKYVIKTGDSTVASDSQPQMLDSHNPHQTQQSPK